MSCLKKQSLIDVSGGRAAQARGFPGRLEAVVTAGTRRFAFAGVVLMLLIGILSAFDVLVMRAIFRSPIAGSNEILETIFSVGLAMVLAGGLADGATLEIDFLKKWLAPKRVAYLRAFGAALFLVLITVIAWRVGDFALQSWRKQTQTMLLQWKVWPSHAAIALMFALCIPVQLLALLRLVAGGVNRVQEAELPEQVGTLLQGSGNADQPRIAIDSSSVLKTIAFIVLAVLVSWAAWRGVAALQPVLEKHAFAWALGMFGALWIVAMLFVPLGAALAACGLLGTVGLMGSAPALSVLGSETIGLITNTDLAVVPLFLMMGGFAVAGGLAQDMYRLAHALFAPFKGGLALATIAGCAGFGAVTGSSLATIATIGPAAYPEMKSRRYSPELSTGCLVAGGTLGVLIPPSTIIVLYALLVEESIGTLYIALLVPALLTVVFYMAAIALIVLRDPSAAPGRGDWNRVEIRKAALKCMPAAGVFIAVFGGMFFGVFTATEAASVGTVLCFVFAAVRGKLSRGSMWPVAIDTTRSTSMLYFVMIGAFLVTFFMGNSGVPDQLSRMLVSTGWPALGIIAAIAVAYIVLGTAMDTITIMMITAPVLAVLVKGLGYDPVWWGIMTVILVEIGVVSPPFGLNLFIIKTIAPDVSLNAVFRGVMPFLAADVVKVAVLIAVPAITLWLPSISRVAK